MSPPNYSAPGTRPSGRCSFPHGHACLLTPEVLRGALLACAACAPHVEAWAKEVEATPLPQPPAAEAGEYPRGPVELLLRARLHMLRAAESYGQAREQLLAAKECLNAARAQLSGEERSQVYALAAQITVRGTEAHARQEALLTYAVEAEEWARKVPAAPHLQVSATECRLRCSRPLTTAEERARGYHRNCPEAPAVQAETQEGGAP